jgi:aminoglycoside phosphotransferase (APT) family kinase protein
MDGHGVAGGTDMESQLHRWAAAHYDATAQVEGLEALPGHAGLSFGFRVVDGGDVLDDLVLRVPPSGVRRSGNTDVLRQVPLLRAMGECHVPVAEVRWWDDDEQWFGVPYLMVGRLPGHTLNVRELAAAGGSPELRVRTAFVQAVEALAAVHAVPWEQVLAGWEHPKDLGDEVVFWDRLLQKAAASEWVERPWVELGFATRDRLLATMPTNSSVGVFHGDFQTNNLLYHDGRLAAVLDWEISGIGAQLLDLGWLLMMNDPLSWADGAGLSVVPPFSDLIDCYASAVGRPVTVADVDWFRALSGYRFGVISCFNVMLHRSGKRPDPEWDRIALSVPSLFGRADELLGAARSG